MKVIISDIYDREPRTITIGKVTLPWPFPVVWILHSSAARVFGRPVYGEKAGRFVKVSYSTFKKISNAKYWIKYRLLPTRYHWIDTGLHPGYHDPSEMMLHAAFVCLGRYIEEAGGLDELSKFSSDLRENPDPNGPRSESSQADDQDEAVTLWKWWTEERPRDKDDHHKLLIILFADSRSYTEPTENPNLVELKFKPFEGDHKAMYQQFRELEKKIDDDEQAMLHRLIDIRRSLWT